MIKCRPFWRMVPWMHAAARAVTVGDFEVVKCDCYCRNCCESNALVSRFWSHTYVILCRPKSFGVCYNVYMCTFETCMYAFDRKHR